MDDRWMDEIIEHAKKSLRKFGTKNGQRICLIGYAGDNAFKAQPMGFSASFGEIENPSNACWHIFKKGFCRHGIDCARAHPVWQVPVRVLVVGTYLDAPQIFVMAFEREVYEIAMAVVAALEDCGCAEKVSALKDKDWQGWTIEVMPKEEWQSLHLYLYDVAKEVLLNVSTTCSHSLIMGEQGHPFVNKVEGFFTIVGAIRNKKSACIDFFYSGMCSRESCRFDHAELMMPISVIV